MNALSSAGLRANNDNIPSIIISIPWVSTNFSYGLQKNTKCCVDRYVGECVALVGICGHAGGKARTARSMEITTYLVALFLGTHRMG